MMTYNLEWKEYDTCKIYNTIKLIFGAYPEHVFMEKGYEIITMIIYGFTHASYYFLTFPSIVLYYLIYLVVVSMVLPICSHLSDAS